jgi:hypothetical protein
MKKLYPLLSVLFLIDFGWGQLGPFSYISPGIQFGYNSKKGFFYGSQISLGIKVRDSINDEFSEISYIPSICFGLKRNNKKLNEKYIDFQTIFFSNDMVEWWDEIKPPIGIGIGKNFSKNSSNYRLKGYTWLLTCFTIDYELERKSFNFSLIPIFPQW